MLQETEITTAEIKSFSTTFYGNADIGQHNNRAYWVIFNMVLGSFSKHAESLEISDLYL